MNEGVKIPDRGSRESFDELLRSTNREGIEDLLTWLHSTDFYTAPASTRYHGSCERGLILHSLSVLDCAIVLNKCIGFSLNHNSVIIASLLHDICKADCYKVSTKNKKVVDPETGRYEWVETPYYEFDEEYPFGGHGSKSVYLASRYISLTFEEAAAINCHMGLTQDSVTNRAIAKAYEEYKLAWLIHAADELSTFIYGI